MNLSIAMRSTSVSHLGFAVFALGLSLSLGTSCGPTKAGDSCDLAATEEPCPDGLECQNTATDDDGDGGRCLVSLGGSCAKEGNVDEIADLCADGAGCGTDEVCGGRGGACDAVKRACASAQTCADVQRGEPTCYPPVRIVGRVIEAIDADGDDDVDPIEGADVIAVDPDGAAITPVATSNDDGLYTLDVPAVRDGDGQPIDAIVTLRASARDHQTFPGGLRAALPIDLSSAERQGEEQDDDVDEAYVIESPTTTVALLLLPEDERGRAAISGKVDAGQESGGVLVVADGPVVEGAVSASAVSDVDGTFRIFNVAPGAVTVRGYARGVQLEPVSVDVGDDDVEDVTLSLRSKEASTVDGNVQIVNAPGGSETSVFLVVASTFDDVFVRGEVPRGLRAVNVDGAFVIDEVPDGEYVVLAAFDNDSLVRDPDENIGGTELVRVTVSGDTTLDQSFKVTEALEVFSPGADDIEVVNGSPTFVFADDSSEDGYNLIVLDAFGDLVWSTDIPEQSGGDEVSVPYEGPALEDGMVYQFRATSIRGTSPISTTEDLKGVFIVELD